ncbi:unnamed protein product [Lathyrus sativus]|nr:unnamed protein product [Lathyrus sativus]
MDIDMGSIIKLVILHTLQIQETFFVPCVRSPKSLYFSDYHRSLFISSRVNCNHRENERPGVKKPNRISSCVCSVIVFWYIPLIL